MKSESITKIAKALLSAQKSITAALKDASNPHFGSDFASIGSVIDAVKDPLNKEGIVFLQFPAPSAEGHLAITTILLHESGEFIEDTSSVPLQKSDPQAYGSAITYARRYALASVVGLKTIDDDAEGAVGRGGVNHTKPTPPRPVASTAKTGGFKLGGKPSGNGKAPAKGKTGMFPQVTGEETNDADIPY